MTLENSFLKTLQTSKMYFDKNILKFAQMVDTSKQDKLTPGNNISIENNIISSTVEEGPQGPPGIDGRSFIVLDVYNDISELQIEHPVGNEGDAYAIGSETPRPIYIWGVDTQDWVNIGPLEGPIGPPGPIGPTGLQGLQGYPGPQGNVGPIGLQGPAGAPGLTGPIGPRGEKGDIGPPANFNLRFDWKSTVEDYAKQDYVTHLDPTAEPTDPLAMKGWLYINDEPGLMDEPGTNLTVWWPFLLQGAPGPQGPQGLPGPEGDRGIAGPQGPSGLNGPIGPVGPEGPPGQALSISGSFPTYLAMSLTSKPVGTAWYAEDTGMLYMVKSDGSWPSAANGIYIQGQRGPIGPQGNAGPQGPQGIEGPQGVRGLQGIQGPIGPQGDRGEKGERGIEGRSFTVRGSFDTASELETEHPIGQEGWAYSIGTSSPRNIYLWDIDINEWINIGPLEGPKGDVGERGPQGLTGANGKDGGQGPIGPAGPQGPKGADGVNGEPGPKGDRGPQGPAGDLGQNVINSQITLATGCIGYLEKQGPLVIMSVVSTADTTTINAGLRIPDGFRPTQNVMMQLGHGTQSGNTFTPAAFQILGSGNGANWGNCSLTTTAGTAKRIAGTMIWFSNDGV